MKGNKLWTWSLGLFIIVMIGMMTANWFYQNRSEAVYNRILNQDGYKLTFIEEGVEAEFFFKPEWIPEQADEVNELGLVIDEKYDTSIILDKVGKRQNDFYLQLALAPHSDRNSGYILSAALIESHRTLIQADMSRWQVTDVDGQDLLEGEFGTGDGPGEITNLFVSDEYRDKFADGAKLRFLGYYSYYYEKIPGEGTSTSLWWPLFNLLLLSLLVILYRRRSTNEAGLVFKIVGYFLLGAFTLNLNNVGLPLGFVIYLLFFRNPTTNPEIKRQAALLGLVLYVAQFLFGRI